MAQTADFLLIHGNGVHHAQGTRELVGQCRQLPGYRGQPIVFNEDDHFDSRRKRRFFGLLKKVTGS